MPDRHLPVRPDLDQLRRQAKELLRALRAREPEAVAALRRHHPRPPGPGSAKLADTQLVLARSYGVPSWPRLKLACQVVRAIVEDDPESLRALVRRHPRLLHEHARGVEGNWGPPMSYAANLGRDRIIRMLRELGADDLQHAFDRACLQGRLETADLLWRMGARPEPGAVMGPAETQSGEGMAFLLERGATLADATGDPLAPVALVLQTYCRNPAGKHRCLELFADHGVELPDTPPMAVHRGRLDLLEAHLERDPGLLSRTFSHEEIWPPSLGCHEDRTLALHGTPLHGATLLHLAVDNDEVAVVRWFLERGGDPDARAAVDEDGFGGHTALFGTDVSQTWRVGLRRDDHLARILLDAGADPTIRASLKKRLRFVADERWHEYLDVTPLEWGRRFHDPSWVNRRVLELLEDPVAAG